MRQVPCYGIIGAGRVARHFHHYFQHQGLPHRSWSRSSSNSQQTIEDLDEFLTQTDIYLILISDSQIHRFLVEHPKLLEKPCIHFSGSTQTDLAQSFHPLMTFGTELYEMEIYRSFPFVCESGEYSFSEIFPALPNPHFIIQTEQRKLYHALCVLAGNFSCLLWDKFFSDLESQFNIPRAAAQIYMNQI